MSWLIVHYPIILSLALFIVSDILALIQYLKYPTNSGVGGVIILIIRFLKQMGAQEIPHASSSN